MPISTKTSPPASGRGVPLFPTLLVVAAVATMIGLGIWQLQRKAEKEALLARYEANFGRPEIAFPTAGPASADALFRRSSAFCLEVAGWRTEAGRSAAGEVGYRFIAECRTGAEGPGLLAEMGVGRNPASVPSWRGGMIRGRITTEPQHDSVFARIFAPAAPARAMLVSADPAPGLVTSAPPSLKDVPDNHLAYAVQWFLFATAATVIYLLALRRRQAKV